MSRSTNRFLVGTAVRVAATAALVASLNACGEGESGVADGTPEQGSGAPAAPVPPAAPAAMNPEAMNPEAASPEAASPEGVSPDGIAAEGSGVTPAPAVPSEGNPTPTEVAPPPSDGTTPEGSAVVPPADVPVDPEPIQGPDPDAATRARCSGTDPIECHFGGQPGNYEVTVVLGGGAAANTTVRAETRRTMLGAVATAAGETRRVTFSVNVRQPEGEPIQAVPAGTPGLDLYFVGGSGAAPALESIGFRRAEDPVVIYIAGDSTVADQNGLAFGGWGQQLPQHFAFPVVVANYSDSGESSGSFLNARPLFSTIEAQLTAKDFVLIQFGHNDKEVTAAAFRNNITALVTRVKDRGASPVLITPVARAQFNGQQVSTQHVNGTGANLPQIIREVAAEQSVPMLDLTARTTEWKQEIGPNGWQAFHANGTDVTHTNDAGARVEAEFVRELLVQAGVEALVSKLR